MEIIPAIDIIEGKCVRLTKGKYKSKKIYKGNPLEISQRFEKAGFKRLHLIDLDGAKEGKIKNWKTIESISKKTNLHLQVGGGIRSQEDIKKLLNFGVKRAILGSLAVKKPKLLKEFLEKFGKEKIIVDVGVKADSIYFQGWQKKAKKEINSFLKDLIRLEVKTIICTDIERDGVLKGPNLPLYLNLQKYFPDLKIIASGGISNKKDLENLSKVGVDGAIVGKAIFEKRISLEDLKSFL